METSNQFQNEKAHVFAKLETSPLPVKWLKFCMKIRYPAGAAISAIMVLRNYSELDIPYMLNTYPFLTGFGILMDASVLIAVITVAFSIQWLSSFSIKAIRISLYLEAAYQPMVSAIHTADNRPLIFILLFLMWALLFAIPNFIYFEKRRYLFDEYAAYPTELDGKFVMSEKAKTAIMRDIAILLALGIVLTAVIFLFP